MQAGDLTEIARVIQLSIAPVFLISGVGALLAVPSGRLGRTIDRARVLEVKITEVSEAARSQIHYELGVRARRAKLIYRAIALGTTSALLICFVIAVLFIGAFFNFPVGTVVSVLFVAAMLMLIVALAAFPAGSLPGDEHAAHRTA